MDGLERYLAGIAQLGPRALSRNKIWEKDQTVAMVMQKPSKFMDIDPILLIFAGYDRLIYINLHA